MDVGVAQSAQIHVNHYIRDSSSGHMFHSNKERAGKSGLGKCRYSEGSRLLLERSGALCQRTPDLRVLVKLHAVDEARTWYA